MTISLKKVILSFLPLGRIWHECYWILKDLFYFDICAYDFFAVPSCHFKFIEQQGYNASYDA